MRFNASCQGQDLARCCSKSRAASRAKRWAAVPICSRCMSKAPPHLIGKVARRAHRAGAAPTACKGALAPIDGRVKRPGALSNACRRKAPASEQVTLEFPDNQLLAALGGAASEAFRAPGTEARCAHRHARQSDRRRRHAEARERAAAVSARALCAARSGRRASPWPKSMPKSASPIARTRLPTRRFGTASIKTAASRVDARRVRPRKAPISI